jgi:hypothetical protein
VGSGHSHDDSQRPHVNAPTTIKTLTQQTPGPLTHPQRSLNSPLRRDCRTSLKVKFGQTK